MARYPLSIPTQLKRDAKRFADEQGVSLNQFILWALAEKVGELDALLTAQEFPLISYRSGSSGIPQAYLAGSGIRVQTIAIASTVWKESPDQIAVEYDLPVAHVRQALDFYATHKTLIDAHIAHEESLAYAELTPEAPSRRRHLAESD